MIDRIDVGPRHDSFAVISEQLDHGLDEAWNVARRGDEIDDLARNLDPSRLRSRLSSLQAQSTASPSAENAAAIASVENQLALAERLTTRSQELADTLRTKQAQLDELVARAGAAGAGDTDTESYARDVDRLVVQLEALHLAAPETRTT